MDAATARTPDPRHPVKSRQRPPASHDGGRRSTAEPDRACHCDAPPVPIARHRGPRLPRAIVFPQGGWTRASCGWPHGPGPRSRAGPRSTVAPRGHGPNRGPDDGCDCRKPASELLHEIARRLGSSLNIAFVVGDSERDILSASAVSASPVLVLTGKGSETQRNSKKMNGVPVFEDLACFTAALLSGELGPT